MSDTEKLIAVIIVWVIPAFIVALWPRTRGKERAFWTFITLWGSWITFGFYLLIAPINTPEPEA